MAERVKQTEANIRFLQADHDTEYIEVFVNKKLIVSKLRYQKVSNYISLKPGTYTIEIVSSEDPNLKLISNIIIIESGKIFTLGIVRKRKKAELFIIQSQPRVPLGETKVRFFHLVYDIPALDFAVKDRDVVFPTVSFQQVTDYLGLTPMTVDLELRAAGSKQIILPMPKLTFKANESYTIVMIGSEKAPSLTIIID